MPLSKQRKNTTKSKKEEDADLEELVAIIEGKYIKEGATKAQVMSLEQKSIMQAVEKAQGRTTNSAKSAEKLKEAWFRNMRELELSSMAKAEYINEEIKLSEEHLAWKEVSPNKYVRYEQFKGTDEEMDFLVQFFTDMLTEPYSSFTYQYFVFGWPDLCITAYGVESATPPDSSVVGEKVGAVVSRVVRKAPLAPLRGYVAMFAVAKHFRGLRLGRRLVSLTVEVMREKGCDEVYLETPLSNVGALQLYMSLGFAKTKFLPRYYLDHSDAVRMKLWLKDALPKAQTSVATTKA